MLVKQTAKIKQTTFSTRKEARDYANWARIQQDEGYNLTIRKEKTGSFTVVEIFN